MHKQLMDNLPLPWKVNESAISRMREAEEYLSSALTRLESSESPSQLVGPLLNRAVVRRWLGDGVGAERDTEQVLRLEPNNLNAWHSKAINLLQKHLLKEVIDCYEECPALLDFPDASSTLAYAYLYTDRPSKCVELLQVLEESPFANLQEIEMLGLLLNSYFQLGNREKIDELSERLLTELPDNPDALSVIAEQNWRDGKPDEAKRKLHDALRNATGQESRDRVMYRLAVLHLNLREFREAVGVFEQIVDPSVNSPILKEYVDALFRANMIPQVLAISKAMHTIGEPVASIMEAEATIFEFLHDPRQARAVRLRAYELSPENQNHLLKAALFSIQLDEFEEARRLVERIEVDRTSDPDELMFLAHLRHALDLPGSVKLAYRARRLGFHRPHIHVGYVQLMRKDAAANGPIGETDVIGINTWVRIKVNGNVKEYTITDEAPNRLEAVELLPNDLLARELMGKRCGEVWGMSPNLSEALVCEVIAVKSKYAFAFEQSLTDFSMLFPHQKELLDVVTGGAKISLHQSNPDRLTTTNTGEVGSYLDRHYPMGAISQALRTSIYQLWAAQLVGENGCIIPTSGDPLENERESIVLSKSGRVIIDWTALLSICYLGIEDEVASRFAEIVVPQAIVDEVCLLILSKEPLVSNRGTNALDEVERSCVQGRNSSDPDVQFLRRVKAFIRTKATAAPLPVSPEVNWDELQSLIANIGICSAAAIEIARCQSLPLYSDDAYLRGLATEVGGVVGFWTQLVLQEMQQLGIMSENDYWTKAKQLCVANYGHISITGDGLLSIIMQSNMAPTDELRKLIGSLLGPPCDIETAILMSAFVLRVLWVKPCVGPGKQEILNIFLQSLVSGRNGSTVLRRLETVLNVHFYVIPGHLDDILASIKIWASQHVMLLTH
jgi:tetratricopeptide (TPR) repeat protein